MYTTIIFDFFDVIRNDPYKAWLKRHNIERTGDYAEASKPLDRGEITVKEFYNVLHKLSGHPPETIAHEYDNIVVMHEHMPELIKTLGKTYKVGLLSNASSDYLRPLLAEHGYEELFDTIVVSGETGLIKPTPEAFHHILEKLEATAEETIFIDDSPANVQAADALGIKGLLFTDYDTLRAQLTALEIKL